MIRAAQKTLNRIQRSRSLEWIVFRLPFGWLYLIDNDPPMLIEDLQIILKFFPYHILFIVKSGGRLLWWQVMFLLNTNLPTKALFEKTLYSCFVELLPALN